jgi:CPA2 family monovalent cation:H+ antiporter-2
LHSELILTIVIAFVAAFIGGFIAGRAGLPPIVGYLLAGIAIGPNTPGGSASTEIALALAEVGVILLMFGVGLHFSVRDLLAVGRIAVPGALGQIAVATVLGLGVTRLWGWSLDEGLILGLCLAVASTVVLLRALEDRNLLESPSGHVAVGWLIVEDLFTVLVLVLLPALAGPDGANGLAARLAGESDAAVVVLSLAQTAVFVVLMLVVGVKVLPRLLTEVVRTGSRELFTLSILAVALGVAFGSSELFGVSLALGAFLAGIVLNESDLSQRAGLEALPLRDAFAVLFFVSVGMLFEPSVLVEEPLHVAAVVVIIVVGKSLAAFAIVTGAGYGLQTGLTVSASLAQVGEFSFILAALALELAVLPEEANSLVLAGAIISITLNPFLFGAIESVEGWLKRWPRFEEFAGRREPRAEATPALRRHTIICGYGRSGSSLARVLSGRRLPFVVIESDPFLVEQARAGGLTCVFGDASQSVVLAQARAAEARTVAVTFDEQPAAALAVQNAKLLNPSLDVVARGAGPGSHGLLRRAGAAEVVDPSLEAALEFVRHVLHRSGINANEIAAIQARWRAEYYQG